VAEGALGAIAPAQAAPNLGRGPGLQPPT
jgi:hypothetical protein